MQMKTKAALRAEVEALSASRQRLAEMITERDSIAGRIDALNAQARRLADAQDCSAIESDLTGLNAKEAAEMATWSRDGKGPAPKMDITRREAINSEISGARARAAAAVQAASPIAGEITRESEALRRIGVPIQCAISEIIADEARPLFADYRAAAVALQGRRALIEQSAMTVMAIGESFGRVGSGGMDATLIFAGLERFSEELRILFSNPPQPTEHEAAAAWLSLSGRLNADASAKLDV